MIAQQIERMTITRSRVPIHFLIKSAAAVVGLVNVAALVHVDKIVG